MSIECRILFVVKIRQMVSFVLGKDLRSRKIQSSEVGFLVGTKNFLFVPLS